MFSHRVFVQIHHLATSLLLTHQYLLVSPKCPLEKVDKSLCTGLCQDMEHDPPVIVEYYAIDEESTKTVVCVEGATTDEMHLVNGQKYYCGDGLSQEHLKGAGPVHRSFRETTWPKKR